MELINNGLSLTKATVNNLFGQCEPWQIASITASTIVSSIWLWNFVFQDESKCSVVKIIMKLD